MKNINPSSYNKVNWWRNKYCWTHGRFRHDEEVCLKKADGQKDKATSLNMIGVSTRGIPEGV